MLENIDKKDVAILRCLDQNVRSSFQQIAKKTNLSKEVVQYRIKQLEKKKIITGYWGQFKLPTPSHGFKLLLKNKSLNKKTKEEFIEFVSKNNVVAWFAETEGNYDFVLSLFSEDSKNITIFLEQLFQKFSKYFFEKQLLRITKGILLNDKYLYPKKELIYKHESVLEDFVPGLDNIDKLLIKELSSNSRAKFSEIAKKINLTPEAVSHRHKKLKKIANPQYKVRIDTKKIGLSYYHLIISLQDYAILKKLVSFYEQQSECNTIMQLQGLYDLHLEFMLPEREINEVIEEFLENFGENISSYQLLNIKKEYLLNIIR